MISGSWYCGEKFSKLIDTLDSTFFNFTPKLSIECVTQIRLCQIEGDSLSCSMSPIQNCVKASRIKRCLIEFPARIQCSAVYDRQLKNQLIKIYNDMYKDLKCMSTIECSKIGIDCWDKTLKLLDTTHNIISLPLSFIDMMDVFNSDTYYPEFLKIIQNEKHIRQTMCW